MSRNRSYRKRKGAALVEFALMALAVYLLIAGGVELGRIIWIAQVLQDAARAAARELAVNPAPPDATFEDALPLVFDSNLLVVDLDAIQAAGVDLDTYFQSLPLLNRALRPVFISETVYFQGTRRNLLRYPGALLRNTSPTPGIYTGGFTVGVPLVVSRSADGAETIQWTQVVTEARANPADAACGQYGSFYLSAPGTLLPQCGAASSPKGLVSLVVHYPFQSAALSAYRDAGFRGGDGAPNPNAGDVIEAAPDGAIAQQNALPANTALCAQCSWTPPDAGTDWTPSETYAGEFGLGQQAALTKLVRPYRKTITGQSIFRREVIQ